MDQCQTQSGNLITNHKFKVYFCITEFMVLWLASTATEDHCRIPVAWHIYGARLADTGTEWGRGGGGRIRGTGGTGTGGTGNGRGPAVGEAGESGEGGGSRVKEKPLVGPPKMQ